MHDNQGSPNIRMIEGHTPQTPQFYWSFMKTLLLVMPVSDLLRHPRPLHAAPFSAAILASRQPCVAKPSPSTSLAVTLRDRNRSPRSHRGRTPRIPLFYWSCRPLLRHLGEPPRFIVSLTIPYVGLMYNGYSQLTERPHNQNHSDTLNLDTLKFFAPLIGNPPSPHG